MHGTKRGLGGILDAPGRECHRGHEEGDGEADGGGETDDDEVLLLDSLGQAVSAGLKVVKEDFQRLDSRLPERLDELDNRDRAIATAMVMALPMLSK